MLTAFVIEAGICFLATAVLGKIFIPVLKSVKMGQKILDIGPRWHKSKEGTPTMGGLFFIVPVLIVGSVSAIRFHEPMLFVHLAFLMANGAIGFVDDYVKFFKKRNAGLTPSQKMILQFAAAAAYVFALKAMGQIDTALKLPFTDTVLELNIVVYCIL
ncbi:MAG: phospho-N-acetylmuramoyl-pentapeptide-transferase, partial [Eubacteriales bacterium]